MSSIAYITGENKNGYSWTIRRDKPYTAGYILHVCYYGKTIVKRQYTTLTAAKKAIKRYTEQ